MKRYENPSMAITVPLENKDYKIMCIYSYIKNTDNYSLTMMLLRNDIDDPHYIDTQIIKSTKENVKSDICRLIEKAESVKYFDKYIERQNYYLDCFDIGNDFFEKEMMKNNG